jgi:uncharacterized ion transporter superfamily protein YfcC
LNNNKDLVHNSFRSGIPYAHWFRFILPLIVKLTVASAIALVVAVWIGYQ